MVNSLPGFDNPNYFTLVLHVKGTKGEWGYYDEVRWSVPYYQKDEMSLIRLDKLCQGIKIEGLLRYFWRLLGKDYREGLRPLGCDNDVLIMCQHAELEGSVDVYVEHLSVNDLRREFSRGIDEMKNKGGNEVEGDVGGNEADERVNEFEHAEQGTMYDEAIGNGYDKGRVEEGDCNDNPTGPIDSHTEVRVEEVNHSVQKQGRTEVDLMDKNYDMDDGDVDVQDVLHELDQRNK
ncbi:hypothetical protein GH714_030524 [Hevea brasiliensis]|uniref:PB1-like domain-containing protein n=1 Tax=Hevea brasiliensis TaxID=3981 RepID=A0A6A6LXH6_HEVBR|nr:hypothetical protein GH714_030524 [Hevea brasiliensis]